MFQNKLVNHSETIVENAKHDKVKEFQTKLLASMQNVQQPGGPQSQRNAFNNSLQGAKAKAQIMNTIPAAFLSCLPINQAIQPLYHSGQFAHGSSQVPSECYPPLKEVQQITNQTYERMQKIEMKKQQEESVCEVYTSSPKGLVDGDQNPLTAMLDG